MSNAHTPGPWKLISHGNETYPFPLSIHDETDENWITRGGTVSSEANARLIAAAPQMLEALEAHDTAFTLPEKARADVLTILAMGKAKGKY